MMTTFSTALMARRFYGDRRERVKVQCPKMDTAEPSSWPYLLGGLICLTAGWWISRKPRLDALFGLLGSPPSGPQERTRLPLLLWFSGAAWAFMWLSMILPFTGGQRPYLVVILCVTLTPLAALAFLAALGWIVFLR